MKRLIAYIFIGLFFSSGAFAADGDISTIVISPDEAVIELGEKVNFNVLFYDSDGNELKTPREGIVFTVTDGVGEITNAAIKNPLFSSTGIGTGSFIVSVEREEGEEGDDEGVSASATITVTGSIPSTFTLSGAVTGADDVMVTLSGDSSDTQTVNDGGIYSFSVTEGGSYTVTPSKLDTSFSPSGAIFSNVASDGTQNFIAETLQPEMSLSVSSLAIGNIDVGVTGTGTFDIINGGNKSLTVSSISSDNVTFTVEPATAVVAAGANQTVTVTFSPVVMGEQLGSITIESNDSDEGAISVNLSGTGIAPEIALSVAMVSFGNIDVGDSGTGTFEIINEGNKELIVSSISSDNVTFTVEPATAVVAAGATQTVTVTFRPVNRGIENALITVESNDRDKSALTVSVSSSGLAPEISLSTDTLAIGAIDVGSSGSGTFDITNIGDSALNISSITIDNVEFSVSPSIATIPPESGQTITVTFSPATMGIQNTAVTIVSSDSDVGSLVVSASGTGLASEISLSTDTVAIGNIDVGDSGTGTFEIINEGNKELIVNSISSDNVTITVEPATAVVAAGASQTVTVTFSPVVMGEQLSIITIESNDSDEGTLTVNLSGTGIAPEIALSTDTVAMGNIDVGGSGTRTFDIINEGNKELLLSGISSDNGVFSVNLSAATILPGESQTVTVTFSPAARGVQLGSIAIDSDEGAISVNLSGTGIAPEIALSVAMVSFGNIDVGDSGTGTFEIINDGNKELVVSSISSDNVTFTVEPANAVVAAGATQTVTVTFSPVVMGDQTGTITIASDVGSLVVSASGTCVASEIALSTDSVVIGNVEVGNSGTDRFLISNPGNKALTVTSISVDNDLFTVSPVSVVIEAGGSQSVTVTFNPGVKGAQSGTISVASDDVDNELLTLSVSGSAISFEVDLSAESLDLGSVDVGSSVSGTFDISNKGSEVNVFSSITSDNPAFTVDTSSVSIEADESQIVTVTFSPTARGAQSGTITLISEDAGTQTVSVSGSGYAAEIALSTDTMMIRNVPVGNSGSGTFTITNSGNKPLAVTGIICDNDSFTLDTSSASIEPGGGQTVTVTFAPSGKDAQTGTITIESDDQDAGTLTVNVSGDVTPTEMSLSNDSLNMGSVDVGRSVSGTFDIITEGYEDITVTRITSDNSAFTVDTSSAVIPANGSQTVTVTFSPTARGAQSGTVTVETVDYGSFTVNAGGTGLAPEIDVSDNSVRIRNVELGSSGSGTFTISNSGNKTLTISGITCDNGSFTLNTSSAIIEPGGSQTLRVIFVPSGKDSKTGTITIVSDDKDEGILTVSVSGSVLSSEISLSHDSLDLGAVDVGTRVSGTFEISIIGNKDVSVTSFTSDNEMFTVDRSSATIIAGTSLTITVSFSPFDAGTQSGIITMESEDNGSFTVSVNGTGLASEIALSTESLVMDDVKIGNSVSGTFVITNDGNKALIVSSISSDDEAFTVEPESANISIGENQTVTVTFNPAETGEHEATITVASDDIDDDSLTVNVSGTVMPLDIRLLVLSPKEVTAEFGDIVQFTADAYDENFELVDTVISWSVIGDVGEIDENGVFIATLANSGSVVATVGDLSEVATVIVTEAVVEYDVYPLNVKENDSVVIFGIQYPLDFLNGMRLFFPENSFSDDITVTFKLPSFANVDMDTKDVSFYGDIISAVSFDVSVNGELVSPYYFDEPIDLTIPYDKERLDELGIDPGFLKMFYVTASGDLESDGISNIYVDADQQIITGKVSHFSDIAVSPKFLGPALIGDFDYNMAIDFYDFIQLIAYWNTGKTGGDIAGQSDGANISGALPFNKNDYPYPPDGVIDFEDLIAFSMMYNWYQSQNSVLKTVPQMVAKTSPSLITSGLHWNEKAYEVGDTFVVSFHPGYISNFLGAEIVLDFDSTQLSVKNVTSDIALVNDTLKNPVRYNTSEGSLSAQTVVMGSISEGIPVSGGSIFEIEFEVIGAGAFSIDMARIDMRSFQNTLIAFNGEILSLSGEIAGLNDGFPQSFSLSQNYPNPFNPVTTIEYFLPKSAHVSLVIYNASGQRMHVFEDGTVDRGLHSYVWDASDVSSGIYFYVLKADGFVEKKKMLFLQ